MDIDTIITEEILVEMGFKFEGHFTWNDERAEYTLGNISLIEHWEDGTWIDDNSNTWVETVGELINLIKERNENV